MNARFSHKISGTVAHLTVSAILLFLPGCTTSTPAEQASLSIPAKARPFGVHRGQAIIRADLIERLQAKMQSDAEASALNNYFVTYYASQPTFTTAIDPAGNPLVGMISHSSANDTTALLVTLYSPGANGSLQSAYAYIEERSRDGLSVTWIDNQGLQHATMP